MNKILVGVVSALILIGVGLTSYWALSNGNATVYGKVMEISPSTYSIKMNASSVYTKNVTISTNSKEEIAVEIKVLPGDYTTSKAWGSDFIAYASPSKVTLDSDHPAKVSIIHYGEKAGSYKVKIIAVK